MTHTTGTPDPPDTAPPRGALERLAAVRSGVLAAVVFVLGLLVGALTIGLLDEDPVVVTSSETPDAGAASAGPSLPDEGASARFVVSGACLRAVNAAQDTLLLVDDLGQAAAELDAAALDEIVRALMPLQTRLQTGLDACEVATDATGGAGEPGGAPASPSPAIPSSGPVAPTDEAAGE
jgi:hypothetical protein